MLVNVGLDKHSVAVYGLLVNVCLTFVFYSVRMVLKAIAILEKGLENSLSFYAFPKLDSRKIASTNVLERLNKEIRRRTRVVGIFPNPDSYLRLVLTYLIEYAEDWSVSKAYIAEETITETLKPAA